MIGYLVGVILVAPLIFPFKFVKTQHTFSQENNYISQENWAVNQIGSELQLVYGSGSNYAQYGVLHLDSGYFRLINTPDSGWGTSIILLPAFWSNGVYYQGSPVAAVWAFENDDLVLTVSGSIHGLDVTTVVRLSPPSSGVLSADIYTLVNGSVAIDERPGEAFKPVFLSSMHISADTWDARSAFVDCNSFPIPPSGWLIRPDSHVITDSFGLVGGTSDWKTNAPTVWLILSQPLQAAGWVTYSTDPNDDNVGMWVASNNILTQWDYKMIVSSSPEIHCVFLPMAIK